MQMTCLTTPAAAYTADHCVLLPYALLLLAGVSASSAGRCTRETAAGTRGGNTGG
jgi:hypothetical protein